MFHFMTDLISGAFLISIALGVPVCILFTIGYRLHRSTRIRPHEACTAAHRRVAMDATSAGSVSPKCRQQYVRW